MATFVEVAEQAGIAYEPHAELYTRLSSTEQFITGLPLLRTYTLFEANSFIPFLHELAENYRAAITAPDDGSSAPWDSRVLHQTAAAVGRQRIMDEAYAIGWDLINADAVLDLAQSACNVDDRARIVAKYVASEGQYKAAEAMAWAVVADQPGYRDRDNPALTKLAFHALGAINTGVYGTGFPGSTEGLRVRTHIPLIGVRNEPLLGCWQEGDTQIDFAHHWSNTCLSTTNLVSGQNRQALQRSYGHSLHVDYIATV